ncbi:DUF4097 domain-containing protein [Halobaculum sp. CBA1158]|uniref:DUF4097 family beta strand repeat-containing protein n=1 Tax=Halobaculum sp. CBA1158 TaxID=2904243 RepID=UPI001F3D52CE|nr:DUF4097 family beta strand repeat-containing protein [Halobaculum sp. CBA1158]UIO98724.1 DUF4097 domain-containing protein [Halobaculum sp. CBA1158]
MSDKLTRRRVLAGGATALLASVAGCSGATPFVGKRTERTETIAVDGASSLAVRTDLGDVSIQTADRDDIDVRIVKQASSVTADLSDLSFRVDRAGEELLLSSEFTGDTEFFGGQPSMSLDVTLPESLQVSSIRSRVGDVTAEGVAGDLDAETDTGDLRLRGVSGAVRATASVGDVVVERPDAIERVTARTGDVTVDVPTVDADTTISSRTGDVSAAVTPEADADLTARTDTGDVSVDGLPLSDSTRTDELVTGTLGSGGPSLDIETRTGDVSVSPLN